MTEKEKMLAGQLYDPSDPELDQLRLMRMKVKSSMKSSKNCFRIPRKYLDYRHRSTLITAAIHISENAAGQILILPA